jgi:O-antigen/teichoic acid export membrane protein
LRCNHDRRISQQSEARAVSADHAASTPGPPPVRLRGKIVRGGAWLGAHYGLRQVLNFFRIIIVARVVTPADVGVIGMAALAITLVRVFTETGLQQAVIHGRDESRDTLDTAWAVLLVRNSVIAIVLAAGAGAVAGFFSEPRAEGVVRVVSVVLLLEGLTNIAVVLFQKRLDFRLQALYLGGGDIFEFIVTVALALWLRNVWALAFGWIAGALARAVLSYVAEPRRPRFYMNRAILASLFGYGKWLTASSILLYILLNGDNLVVGRFMGTAALGFYQIAYTVSNVPATAISHVISGVLFPAYASMQGDIPRLSRVYLRSLRMTALLSAPLSALIAALAGVFVPVLLGEKWAASIPIMQVLALFGLMRAFGATTGSVFLAIGRPDIRTFIQTFQVIIFAAVLYPMAKAWGMVGVAGAVTVYSVTMNAYAVVRASRECRVPAARVVEALSVPLAAGAAAYASVAALRAGVFTGQTLVDLIVLGLAGTAVYIGAIAVYDALAHKSWRADLLDLIEAVRRRDGEAPSPPPHP